MKTNILKVFGFAALLALGVTTSVSAAVTPDGLEAAIKAAADGETIELGEGVFTTYGTEYANNRKLTFVGAGIGKTIWKYGSSENKDGEYGVDYSWRGASLAFEGITFTDNCEVDNYFRGFANSASLTFTSCEFTNMAGCWGDGPVIWKSCIFDVGLTYEYCVKTYNGSDFTFDDCTVRGYKRGFIQLFKQDSSATVHKVIVKDCKFEKKFDGPSKTAVYFYDQGSTEGARWDIDLQGDNVNVNDSLPVNETTGSWLWGDMKYNDAGTAVVKMNGAIIFANNQKVDPQPVADAEVVPEKPTQEKAEEATKVVDESGAVVVTPTTEQTAAAKAEVEKVVESFDNPEIAKVEKTGVTEAATTVTGEGGEQKVVVKSAIVEELKKAAPQGTTDQITSESDVKSYVKVAFNEARVSVAETTAALKSVTFDVKPMAETTVTVDKEKAVVVTQIPNAEIAKPIIFRLPLTDAFTVSAKVRHESEDHNYETEEFVCPVKGLAGGRYVEITTTHFSTFILSPYNAVVTESDETLGIVKVAKTAGGETVAGVPFKKFDVTSGAAMAMTVDQLLVAGFGQDDDIYAYNPAKPSGDEYDMWAWDEGEWSGVAGQTGMPTPSESAEIASGKAFWFKDESGSTTPLTLAGLYRENVTTKVDVGKKSLLVNPYPVAINAAEKLKKDACTGDQFSLLGGDARYEFRNGEWGTVAKGEVIKELPGGIKIYGSDTFTPAAEIVIPAGQAFWYISTGATAPTVVW